MKLKLLYLFLWHKTSSSLQKRTKSLFQVFNCFIYPLNIKCNNIMFFNPRSELFLECNIYFVQNSCVFSKYYRKLQMYFRLFLFNAVTTLHKLRFGFSYLCSFSQKKIIRQSEEN